MGWKYYVFKQLIIYFKYVSWLRPSAQPNTDAYKKHIWLVSENFIQKDYWKFGGLFTVTSIRIGRNWTTDTHQFSKLLSLHDHSEEKPGTDKHQVIWGIYKSIVSILDASGVGAHKCGSVLPWPNISDFRPILAPSRLRQGFWSRIWLPTGCLAKGVVTACPI